MKLGTPGTRFHYASIESVVLRMVLTGATGRWLYPGEPRSFALIGVYGQRISVVPGAKLVMVQTSVREKPIGNVENDRESAALWQALQRADHDGRLIAKP